MASFPDADQWMTGWPDDLKNCLVFWKVAQTVAKKGQNVHTKVQLESPTHLHQNHKMPRTKHVFKILILVKIYKLAQAKSSPKCSHFFGILHFYKNDSEFQEQPNEGKSAARFNHHVSISPTFYEQLLRQNPFTKKIQNPNCKDLKAVQRTFVWLSFHQYFMSSFFIPKFFAHLLCAYNLGLLFFGKRILAQKLLIKCWWKLTPCGSMGTRYVLKLLFSEESKNC
jgi:hypothetical protein